MSIPPSFLSSLALVAAHLPFHVTDTQQVNATFQRWHAEGDSKAQYTIDLWTYCFVHHYFLVKFAHNTAVGPPSDMDSVIERVYLRIQKQRRSVSQTTRYASWVSVVCRHAFLNYLRGQHRDVSLEGDIDTLVSREDWQFEAGLVLAQLQHAIERLPPFLQEVARLRFIEDYSYTDIGELTGKPLPTVRSYVNKAMKKLRSDPQIREYLGTTLRDDQEDNTPSEGVI